MTHDHDIERVLDRWFSEGPTQMPARFLVDTLDRIDRAPKPRLAGLRTRFPAMHPSLRFAAAAVIVLAVAGLGVAVLTRTGGVGSTPGAGSGSQPSSLQGTWHSSGERTVPADEMVIDAMTLSIWAKSELLSSVSVLAPDRIELRVVTIGGDWHCNVGDTGTYVFSLSSGDEHLTLAPTTDTCMERATFLSGDWDRTDVGDLQPGRHDATLFRPFGGGTAGRLAYTVPAGWSRTGTAEAAFTLARPSVSDHAALRLLATAFPSAQDDCSVNRGADGVGATPAAFAAWLKALPGLVVSTPTAITVGGLDGVMVDLSIGPGREAPCDAGYYTFSFGGPEEGGWSDRLLLKGSDRARYILLDRGGGSTLVIDIEAPDPEWDAFSADAMRIVEGLEFTR
jgi:hypothetical protein